LVIGLWSLVIGLWSLVKTTNDKKFLFKTTAGKKIHCPYRFEQRQCKDDGKILKLLVL
jgi:hypothetical protein